MPNNKPIYCKVVRIGPKNEKLSSYIQQNDLITRYKVHRYVTAPIGGLLVYKFDSQAVLDLFIRNNCIPIPHNCELWKVLVKEEVRLPNFRALSTELSLEKIHDIWEYSGVFNQFDTCWWPPCTAAFKQVRLEKKLLST